MVALCYQGTRKSFSNQNKTRNKDDCSGCLFTITMSTINLRSQIREDHLTCTICCEDYKTPKALPCLHTFCEGCLRDYVMGRGYDSSGNFPCPVCRGVTQIPTSGVSGFPNNHLMASLSDTVLADQPKRPVPKPRRSLAQNICPSSSNQDQEMEKISSPCKDFNEETDLKSALSDHFTGGASCMSDVPPPPYSTVADTNPSVGIDLDPINKSKLCSNDIDPNFMVVPKDEIDIVPGSSPTTSGFSIVVTQPNNVPNTVSNGNTSTAHPPQIGWNVNVPQLQYNNQHPNQYSNQNPTSNTDFPMQSNTQAPPVKVPPPRPPPPVIPPHPIYPTVPQGYDKASTVCAENLILRFGKQGHSVRDFVKPIGLAVSKQGWYIISDNGGEQSRMFIYDSSGELKAAFKTGYKVEDISMTKSDEIFAAVQSNTCAFRQFTLGGQLKGEHGKFFAYESPSGIAVLNSNGVVISGPQNYCIYVLTDQMKLATKFGRKGNGDGYFSSPAHVASNSKNHIIVSDKTNNVVQIFNAEGKFKYKFSAKGGGQLQNPLGICVDDKDNIIVADSGNYSVEVFSPHGSWLSSVVKNTYELGEEVKPVNVAFTPTGKVAVLMKGPYFAEVRVYSSQHQLITQDDPVSTYSIPSIWYSK